MNIPFHLYHFSKLLDNDSELFLWDKCVFKVYPFDLNKHHENDICQCTHFQCFISDHSRQFDNPLIDSIL